MSSNLSAIFYLISGILFILALRGLSSPETSRQGNYFGIAGMAIAIIVTFLSTGNFGQGFIYVLSFLIIVKTSLTNKGESPMEGSSIKIILGLAISALPIANICCSPPDK